MKVINWCSGRRSQNHYYSLNTTPQKVPFRYISASWWGSQGFSSTCPKFYLSREYSSGKLHRMMYNAWKSDIWEVYVLIAKWLSINERYWFCSSELRRGSLKWSSRKSKLVGRGTFKAFAFPVPTFSIFFDISTLINSNTFVHVGQIQTNEARKPPEYSDIECGFQHGFKTLQQRRRIEWAIKLNLDPENRSKFNTNIGSSCDSYRSTVCLMMISQNSIQRLLSLQTCPKISWTYNKFVDCITGFTPWVSST